MLDFVQSFISKLLQILRTIWKVTLMDERVFQINFSLFCGDIQEFKVFFKEFSKFNCYGRRLNEISTLNFLWILQKALQKLFIKKLKQKYLRCGL